MRTHGKNLLIIAFLVLFTFSVDSLSAQNHRNSRPSWAPVHGQRVKMKARHIYFPEYNFYYDLQRDVYIFLDRGGWRVSVHTPRFLRYVDLGNSVQVALAINTNTPFYYNREHRRAYYKDDFDRSPHHGHHRKQGRG